MGEIAVYTPRLPAMSAEAIENVRRLRAEEFKKPQVALEFQHDLDAGMYARTMIVPELLPDEVCVITAALIKVPTLMISFGDALVYTGQPEPLRLTGHMITRGAAGRCQVFIAQSGFRLIMIFPTKATTIEEAEREFTDEADLLQSRRM